MKLRDRAPPFFPLLFPHNTSLSYVSSLTTQQRHVIFPTYFLLIPQVSCLGNAIRVFFYIYLDCLYKLPHHFRISCSMGTYSLYICLRVHSVWGSRCLLFEIKSVIMSLGQPNLDRTICPKLQRSYNFPLTSFYYVVSLFIWSKQKVV